MDVLTDFLLPIIPAILVFATAFFFLDRMRKDHKHDMQLFQKIALTKETIPLRLKAVERLTIMLERIKPSDMVMRKGTGTKSGAQLQLELLGNIRDEFEHNVSMQIYVSAATWMKVQKAKDDTVELIRVAASQAGQESGALQLSRIIFDLEGKTGNAAIKDAIAHLKAEAAKLM